MGEGREEGKGTNRSDKGSWQHGTFIPPGAIITRPLPRSTIRVSFSALSRDVDHYLNMIAFHDLRIGPLEIREAILNRQLLKLQGQEHNKQRHPLEQALAGLQNELANARTKVFRDIEAAHVVMITRLNLCRRVNRRIRNMGHIRTAALLGRFRDIRRN